jgi:NTP pyrophosphatase (non-canonical NTP hydrolase)
MDRLDTLLAELRRFEAERDWAQFHSPKNLVMALTAEVGELVEHFRWCTEAESDALAPEVRAEVRRELGDVVLCLLQLGDRLGLDPIEAAVDKLAEVRRRYPADQVRGKALKYSAYASPDDGGETR